MHTNEVKDVKNLTGGDKVIARNGHKPMGLNITRKPEYDPTWDHMIVRAYHPRFGWYYLLHQDGDEKWVTLHEECPRSGHQLILRTVVVYREKQVKGVVK